MFQRAIEEKGLVLTEELLQQFQASVSRSALQLVAEISFNEYGRFKDMSQVRYGDKLPPLEALESFVKTVGLGQFGRVPGYRGRSVSSINEAARRIAAAILFSRRKVPVVKKTVQRHLVQQHQDAADQFGTVSVAGSDGGSSQWMVCTIA